MTITEFHLARQGYEAKREQDLRTQANWMSMILSSQSTEPITAAQLLGEEEPEAMSIESRVKEAERDLAKKKKKYPHLF